MELFSEIVVPSVNLPEDASGPRTGFPPGGERRHLRDALAESHEGTAHRCFVDRNGRLGFERYGSATLWELGL